MNISLALRLFAGNLDRLRRFCSLAREIQSQFTIGMSWLGCMA